MKTYLRALGLPVHHGGVVDAEHGADGGGRHWLLVPRRHAGPIRGEHGPRSTNHSSPGGPGPRALHDLQRLVVVHRADVGHVAGAGAGRGAVRCIGWYVLTASYNTASVFLALLDKPGI